MSSTAQQRQDLCLSCLRMAHGLSLRYWRSNRHWISLEEVQSRAFLMLVIAADNFDPSQSIKFSTFAYNYIHLGLRSCRNDMQLLSGARRDARLLQGTSVTSIESKLPGTEVSLSEALLDPRQSQEEILSAPTLEALALIADRAKLLTKGQQKTCAALVLSGGDIVSASRSLGVTHQAVHHQLKTIKERLRPYLLARHVRQVRRVQDNSPSHHRPTRMKDSSVHFVHLPRLADWWLFEWQRVVL